MVENGLKRSEEFSNNSLTAKWTSFLDLKVPALYEEWLGLSSVSRKTFFSNLFLSRAKRSIESRMKRLTNS